MLDPSRLKKFVSSSRIVHRLPGRIRIRIPILEKLPGEWLTYSKHTAEIIKMRKGIEDVKIQPLTGSLTIRFNPDQIEETGILSWLRTIVKAFLNFGVLSVPVNEADIRLRFAHVRDRFNGNDRARYLNSGSMG